MQAFAPTQQAARCTPTIRLTTLAFTVNRGDGFAPRFEDVRLPVIALRFDYGGYVIEASDAGVAQGPLCLFNDPRPRDPAREQEARVLLEKCGAVDLDCLDDYGRDLAARADYLVSLDEDPAAYCAFTATAVPELRRAGFVVELDPDYPYRLLTCDVSWYAQLIEDGGVPGDWFGLELGVEIEGTRVNLVTVLLELLSRSGEIASLRALARGTERLLVVPVPGHGYVQITPQRLKQLWAILTELHEGPQVPDSGVCRPDDPALRELDRVFQGAGEGLRWHGAARPAAAAAAPAGSLSDAPALPDALPVRATLRPYQREGVRWLQARRRAGEGGILADDMGLGKTLQTITHLALEHAGQASRAPSLIVCPTSLVVNWQREIGRFAPRLRACAYHGPGRHKQREQLDGADIIITSYPILLRDDAVLTALDYHVLVLDEAQAIKNPSSAIHQAVKTLRAAHRLCLTGTPIENHLGELWALFDFLAPGLLGSEDGFRARFRQLDASSLKDRAQLSALRSRVAPRVLRRMKDAVATDLPSKLTSIVPVALAGKQRELYESVRAAAHHDVRRAIRQKGIENSAGVVLDALMKLRQICCDPRLLQLSAARFVRESEKLARLLSLLETHLELKRRVLVFSQFTSMLDLIAQALAERDIDHLMLTGATRQRQARVDAFEQRRAEVFLISLKAGGAGLNLVSADTVIHYDPWWNPAVQDQATDRAYRIGQTKPVLVQELIVAGSVEERMRGLAERKRALSRAILAGDTSAELHEAEIEELFAPLEGSRA